MSKLSIHILIIVTALLGGTLGVILTDGFHQDALQRELPHYVPSCKGTVTMIHYEGRQGTTVTYPACPTSNGEVEPLRKTAPKCEVGHTLHIRKGIAVSVTDTIICQEPDGRWVESRRYVQP